jgi:adenine phosphoribosyltransferase
MIADHIRDIPNFPKEGIIFKDITPILANPDAFNECISGFEKICKFEKADAIAAIEARGFLFAAPLAFLMNMPLIPLRKPGKLPYHTHSFEYNLEYGKAELHVHTDAIKKDMRILLVDDLLATGGTMEASCRLIEKCEGKIAACCFVIELSFLEGRNILSPNPVYSLVKI